MSEARRYGWGIRMKAVGRALALATMIMVVGGCATQQPVLYPNAHYKQVGPSVAQADVGQCVRLAETHGVRSSKRGPNAENVAVNTGAGAAGGAARGAIYGRGGRGAAAGAAGAASSTIVRGILRPRNNPAHRRFVEQCLRERGYKVTGWQ